jgi:hypothetical protein
MPCYQGVQSQAGDSSGTVPARPVFYVCDLWISGFHQMVNRNLILIEGSRRSLDCELPGRDQARCLFRLQHERIVSSHGQQTPKPTFLWSRPNFMIADCLESHPTPSPHPKTPHIRPLVRPSTPYPYQTIPTVPRGRKRGPRMMNLILSSEFLMLSVPGIL